MPAKKVTSRPLWLKSLWLGLAYFVGAEVSYLLTPHRGVFVSFWLPAGVYLASLLLADTSDWVALALTANVVNLGFDLHQGTTLALSVELACANTVVAVGGAWWFRRFVARTTQLTVLREFLGFLACAVVSNVALGATLGAAALVAAGDSHSYPHTWITWWIGNAMAILMVAPFVLIWAPAAEAKGRGRVEPRRLLEAALIVLGLFAVAWQILVRGDGILTHYKTVLMPFILWAALRFGTRGASAINLFLTLLLTFLTVHYLQGLPPAQIASGSYLPVMQMFLTICALVGLIPAIALAERDRLVAQLGDSEERYRSVLEGNPEAVIVHRDDVIIYLNPAAVQMLGANSASAVAERRMLDLVHADFRELVLARRRHLAAHGFTGPMVEMRFLRLDGTAVEVEVQSAGVRYDGAPAIQVTAHEIGPRKAAEEARQRAEAERQDFERKAQESQKLESLGVLAGGIAHDFNNILSGISGYASLARMAASRGAPQTEYLDEIGRATQRAAELVRQILAFSRTGQAMVGRVQMRHAVDEAVRLLRATIPSTIAFETHLAPDLPAVSGDASQLHQIVMNLGTNAWHAMRERPGRLTIQLEGWAVDAALAQALPGIQPGPHVRLTVSDNGSGMGPETQQRVFEPFFTTKAPGEGTGLGLSVVHGIVRNHRGAIRLTSEIGRGTTFEIYLPAVASPPLDRREDAPTAPPGRGERILFVDDEIPIMNIGRISLGQVGYEVVAEGSAADALARLERAPGSFDLVVTDQTMPELTGLEFARRVRALRSDLPVILATGYSINLVPEEIQAAGICEVLEKPYTIGMLAAAVRRHLPLKPAV